MARDGNGRIHVPHGFAPLRSRPFALFWTGALVSNIGNWMETVAAGVLVTETTHRAGWTGAIAVAGFLPSTILGPVGGALADRLPRKPLLIVTNLLEMALAALLAMLAAHGNPAPLSVASILFCSGCVAAIGMPAYQTILPDLVPREDLLGAIALSSAQWNLGRVIGPALAGAVIALGGYGWAFALNAASFLAVVVALLAIRLPIPSSSQAQAFLHGLAEGVRFVQRDRGVRAAVGAVALASLLAGPFIALVPAMAIGVLHAGPRGAATLVSSQGLGAVIVAFFVLAPLAQRFGRPAVLLATLALLPPALVAYANAPALWLAIPAIMVLGGLYLSMLSGLSTVIQLRVPTSLRGRVLSLHGATLSLMFPIGSVLQGTLADHIGLRLTTTIAALRLWRPQLLLALREPGSEGIASQPARIA